MRNLFTLLPLLSATWLINTAPFPDTPATSPLASYSAAWNEPRYLKCNTAANVSFLTAREKEIIYILNLMRVNPALFNSTVVKQYPDKCGRPYLRENEYYNSLFLSLGKVKPLPLLKADNACFESARCHALTAGAAGYVGHDRLTDDCRDKERFGGECCQYGYSQPLDIVMALMIDDGVPSLGHRMILLMSFTKIGVSVQAHEGYGTNTVLDLD